MAPRELQALLGGTDIYLLDQILRGNIAPGMKIFDAGCGGGRNLAYFLRAGFEVAGIDSQPGAIAAIRDLAASLAPSLPAEAFRCESLESHTFEDAAFDVVICSAVLHFARDEAQFLAMLEGSWRPLRPGGLFFCRLASTIGMPERHQPLGGRRFQLPDGSRRFLVDEAFLLELTERLGGELVDPLKTTVVQDQRCMTTWVLRRSA
jgi:tellurite methyltransferase